MSRLSTWCGLFVPNEDLSKDESFWLAHQREVVFDWLVRLTHWLAVRHTLTVIAKENTIEVQALRLRPNYEECYFYWAGLTVWIEDEASCITPFDSNVLSYQMQFDKYPACSFDFRVYLAAQIDAAIKTHFPGIQQRNQVTYCSSPRHSGASPLGCRKVEGGWLCPECEVKG
jgi:hypothetical protein